MKKFKIKELGTVITGNTPSKKQKEYYESEDICFIKPDIILENQVCDIIESREYISEKARNKARVVKKGDIFITCIGTIGKIGISQMKECAFNQQINVIQPNDRVYSKYLAYCLLYNRKKLVSIANAPVVPIINKTQFEEFEVYIDEDKERQLKVVELLDRIVNIIDLRQKQIEDFDLLVKSQFVKMFGDPIDNPMNWDVKMLKELTIKIISGSTPKGGNQVYVESGITFLRSQNVWKNRIELDDVVYITPEIHLQMKESSLKSGDILITKTGRVNTPNSSLGRAAIYIGEDDEANINGHVYLVRLKSNVNIQREFILSILVSDSYRDYIRKVCVGGIDKRQINKNHLEQFPIIVPPLSLQNQFVTFVQQVDKSKLAVQKSLEELETLKQALMQQYFGVK